MAYIYGGILVFVVFILLHYATTLTKKQKLTLSLLVTTLVLFGFFYNTYQQSIQKKLSNTILKFQNGKTLHCDNTEINNTNFTLSIGTYTFIGKEGTPYYSKMVNAQTCQDY